MKNYKFNRLAHAEMIESARYYAAERTGYGRLFLDSVRKAVDLVRKLPGLGTIAVRKPQIRALRVNKFWHSVLYSIHEDLIYIIAVSHHAREPLYWIERIKDLPPPPPSP